MIETTGNQAGLRPDPTANGAPVQYAQADGAAAPPPAAAIGTATKVSGQVTVKHADGSQEALKDGAAIKVGDDIVTGADGKVGLVFDDGSTFALGAKGHMSVDEMTLPSAQGLGGKQTINVDSGSFSLASGAIAKAYPDAMVLKTPVASIGIRGTTVAGQAAPEGSANTISLLPDADGTVGQVSVTTQAGTQVLSQPGATTQVSSAFAPPAPPVILSPQQLQQQYGDTLQTLPPPPSPEQLQQMQQQRQADAQTEAEETAEEQAEAEAEATAAAAAEQAQSEGEAARAALDQALDNFFNSAFGDFGPAGDAFGDLMAQLDVLFASFDPFGQQGVYGGFDFDALIAELGQNISELIDDAIQDLIDDLEDQALQQPFNLFDLSDPDLGSTYTLITTDGETDYVIGTGAADTVTLHSGSSMGVGDTFVDYTSGDGDTLILAANTENVGWRVAGVETINLQHTTGPNTFIIGNDGATSITVGAGVDSISSSVVSQAPGLLVTDDQQWTIGGNLNNDNLNMGYGTDKLYLGTHGTHSATLNGVEEVYFDTGPSPIALTLNAGVSDMTVTGSSGADQLILADGGNSVSVSGIETLVGGSGNDSVTLIGSGINTVKVSDIEVLTGNASATDIITSNLDTLDVSAMTLNSIEQLRVDSDNIGASNSVTVLGSQLGTGKITTITFRTGTEQIKTLLIGDSSADLSAVTLTNFSQTAKNIIAAGSSSGVAITGTNNADNIQGAAGDDTLSGGQGNDTLTGGLGADTLSGGIGNDVFYYSSADQFGDVITDFTAGGGGDKMTFLSSYFTGFTDNAILDSTYFVAGSAATTADHRFIWDVSGTVGDLYYDSDGTGSAAQVKVATITLEGGHTFAYNDIYISST